MLPLFNVRVSFGPTLVANLTSGKVTLGQGAVKASSTKDVSLTAGSWIYQPSTKGMPAPPGSPTSATASFTVFLGISPYLARQALLTYPVTFNPKNQNTFPFTYQTYNNPLITAAWSVARGSTPTAILTALRAKYNTASASRSAWDALSPVGPVNHATFARIMYEEGFASEPVAAALKAASEPQPGTALRMACYNALQNARGLKNGYGISSPVTAVLQMDAAGHNQSETADAIQTVYGLTPAAMACVAVSAGTYSTADMYRQLESYPAYASDRAAATAVLKGCGVTAAACAAGLLDQYPLSTDQQVVSTLFQGGFTVAADIAAALASLQSRAPRNTNAEYTRDSWGYMLTASMFNDSQIAAAFKVAFYNSTASYTADNAAHDMCGALRPGDAKPAAAATITMLKVFDLDTSTTASAVRLTQLLTGAAPQLCGYTNPQAVAGLVSKFTLVNTTLVGPLKALPCTPAAGKPATTCRLAALVSSLNTITGITDQAVADALMTVERATLDAASSVAAGAQQQGIGGLCLQMSTWYNTSAVRLAKLTTGRITGQQFALIPTPSTSDVAYCLVNSINGADIVTSASPRQFVDYARQALNSTASAGYVMRALASHPAYASLFGADNADQLFAAMRLPIDSETGYPAIVWYPAPAIASAYRVDNPAVTPTDLLTEFAQASYTVGDLADILRLVYGLAAADIINALTQLGFVPAAGLLGVLDRNASLPVMQKVDILTQAGVLTQPAVTCAYVVSLVPINGNSVNAAAWRQNNIPLELVVRCVGGLFSADPLQATIFGYAAAVDGGYTVGTIAAAAMSEATNKDCSLPANNEECTLAASYVNQALALKKAGLMTLNYPTEREPNCRSTAEGCPRPASTEPPPPDTSLAPLNFSVAPLSETLNIVSSGSIVVQSAPLIATVVTSESTTQLVLNGSAISTTVSFAPLYSESAARFIGPPYTAWFPCLKYESTVWNQRGRGCWEDMVCLCSCKINPSNPDCEACLSDAAAPTYGWNVSGATPPRDNFLASARETTPCSGYTADGRKVAEPGFCADCVIKYPNNTYSTYNSDFLFVGKTEDFVNYQCNWHRPNPLCQNRTLCRQGNGFCPPNEPNCQEWTDPAWYAANQEVQNSIDGTGSPIDKSSLTCWSSGYCADTDTISNVVCTVPGARTSGAPYITARSVILRNSLSGPMDPALPRTTDGLVPVLGISRAEDHRNLVKSMFQIQTQVAMAIGDDDSDQSMVNMTWLTDASQPRQGQRMGMYMVERVISTSINGLKAVLQPPSIALADETPSPELVASMYATLAFIAANKNQYKLTVSEKMVLDWWAAKMHERRVAIFREAVAECHKWKANPPDYKYPAFAESRLGVSYKCDGAKYPPCEQGRYRSINMALVFQAPRYPVPEHFFAIGYYNAFQRILGTVDGWNFYNAVQEQLENVVLKVPDERADYLYTKFGNGTVLDALGQLQFDGRMNRMLELMPDLVMASSQTFTRLADYAMINTVKKRARAAANKQLETTGTTEADRSFNDLNSKSPKAKQRAAIAQKATFKGSAKSMPARLPAAAAADVTEAGSKVIAKTAMRTITKIVRTAGRALGPIGVLVEVAGIAFSLYEEITDILEYNNVCEKYETRYEEVKAMDPMTIRGALLEENQINDEAGSSDFMTFATFVQLVLGDGGSLAGRDWGDLGINLGE